MFTGDCKSVKLYLVGNNFGFNVLVFSSDEELSEERKRKADDAQLARAAKRTKNENGETMQLELPETQIIDDEMLPTDTGKLPLMEVEKESKATETSEPHLSDSHKPEDISEELNLTSRYIACMVLGGAGDAIGYNNAKYGEPFELI